MRSPFRKVPTLITEHKNWTERESIEQALSLQASIYQDMHVRMEETIDNIVRLNVLLVQILVEKQVLSYEDLRELTKYEIDPIETELVMSED